MSDQPAWIELIVSVPVERQEEAIACLLGLGWEQWWTDQASEAVPTADGWGRRCLDPDHVRLHIYLEPGQATGGPAATAARLAESLGELARDVGYGEVAAREWLEEWRLNRTVVPVGSGWAICPPWLREQVSAGCRPVVIDPGLAFGAGDHPTTRDSATLLAEVVRPGDRLLDLGAGSGVLSILGCLAAARLAVAVELDKYSVKEIRRNAVLNQADGVVAVWADALTVGLAARFDLVLINIGALLAEALVPRLEEWAEPETRLVVSGLTDWTVDRVAATYAAAGWTCRRRLQQGSEWVSLLLERVA